jgi:hypothetical protein
LDSNEHYFRELYHIPRFLAGIISWSVYCTGHVQMLMTRDVPSAAPLQQMRTFLPVATEEHSEYFEELKAVYQLFCISLRCIVRPR